MMLEEKQLQELLRLKRFEQPPPGFFERNLDELHRRQRAELLQHSAFQIWWDRLSSGLWSFRMPVYAYGGAFGAFVVLASLLASGVIGPKSEEKALAVSLSEATAQASASKFALNRDLDWSELSQRPMRSSSSVVPVIEPSGSSLPRYILEGRPVSYEASFNF
jgi:hypothetical protein